MRLPRNTFIMSTIGEVTFGIMPFGMLIYGIQTFAYT
jgi:hypothetical protein